MKPTTYFRALLAAATLVSLGGNSAHAIHTFNGVPPLWFTVAWSAVPPLALPLTVHGAGILSREQGRAWAYKSVVAAVIIIAALAFTISFVALRDLTLAMGSTALIAIAFPILVDATATVATVALLVLDDSTAMRTDDAVANQGDALADAPEPVRESGASAESSLAPIPMPAANQNMPMAEPASPAHHPLTSSDAPLVHTVTTPALPTDHLVRTVEINVMRGGADVTSPSESADPLMHLAERLVQERRTSAGVETVHNVLVRTAAGASSRAVAAELGTVSYSAVQRITRAARELSGEAERRGLSLVG